MCSSDLQAVNDLLGGSIQLFIDTLPGVLAHVKTGKLKVLAVLGAKRTPFLPEAPTIAEAGVPDATGQSWNALVARAGTSIEVVRKINTDVVSALKQADVIARLASVGFTPIGSSPEELSEAMRSDLAKWGKVIRDNNLKPEGG